MATAGTKPGITIIGAGRLACALIPTLAAAGYPIRAVASRRIVSARRACKGLTDTLATTDPIQATAKCQLLLLTVPDREIKPMAQRLAGAAELDWPGRTVLHHSGALGLDVLQSLARAGASIGLLHPLQTLVDPTLSRKLLKGSRARVEGEGRARTVAMRLARVLGMVPLKIKHLTPPQRAAYHAAASLLSNDLLALLSWAVELMESIGLERRAALEALLPLVEGSIAQAAQAGIGKALTGPAVRGDTETLSAHNDRLSRLSGDAAEVHRLLSLRLIELAGRR
jgi:predicted short-subunit dehydrogenase-like oxidoreductase (DUF2520 family)